MFCWCRYSFIRLHRKSLKQKINIAKRLANTYPTLPIFVSAMYEVEMGPDFTIGWLGSPIECGGVPETGLNIFLSNGLKGACIWNTIMNVFHHEEILILRALVYLKECAYLLVGHIFFLLLLPMLGSRIIHFSSYNIYNIIAYQLRWHGTEYIFTLRPLIKKIALLRSKCALQSENFCSGNFILFKRTFLVCVYRGYQAPNCNPT